jgi:hypothetical protein
VSNEGTYDAFLSHSHLDADMVEELARRLEDNANLSVWLDKWVLVPGENWIPAMARGLDEARSCVVCVGENTPRGWYQQEIQRALARQVRDPSFRVIPLLLPGAQTVNVNDFLELRTWVDMRSGLDDKDAFHRLVCGIKGVAPGRGPGSKKDLVSPAPVTTAQPQVSAPVGDAAPSRRADLEQSIRESYEIIRDYERQIQVSDRPEEKLRARRAIAEQWNLIEGYLNEYSSLAGGVLSADVAEIAAHFR